MQMGVTGQNYQAKGEKNFGGLTTTSLPQRDAIVFFAFDIFYDLGHEKSAEDFQNRMQKIVDDHFTSGNQEKRMFWGTFRDTNMKDPKIVDMYYNDRKDYERLQDLKRRVDPNDVFSTEMTVKT
jgi:FAD/FMN-containing dehydrogenase